jgi:hypothetical protein
MGYKVFTTIFQKSCKPFILNEIKMLKFENNFQKPIISRTYQRATPAGLEFFGLTWEAMALGRGRGGGGGGYCPVVGSFGAANFGGDREPFILQRILKIY